MHGVVVEPSVRSPLELRGPYRKRRGKESVSWVIFHRKRISRSPSRIMGNIAYIVSGRGEEREEDTMRQPPCPGCAPPFFWEVAPF